MVNFLTVYIHDDDDDDNTGNSCNVAGGSVGLASDSDSEAGGSVGPA